MTIAPTDRAASRTASPLDEARAFIQTLCPDEAEVPGSAVLFTTPGELSVWMDHPTVDALAEQALVLGADRNVYLGMARQDRARAVPAGKNPSYYRGGNNTASTIFSVWAEIDVAHPTHKHTDLPPSFAAVSDALDQALPLRPTLWVDSGHGLHGHWVFRDPWILDTFETRQEAADFLARFQATIRAAWSRHGWWLDSTADLARVLRVPGTVNHKDPSPPVPVRLLDCFPERRYDRQDDLERYLVDPSYSNTSTAKGDRSGSDDFPMTHLEPIVKGCAWLRHCRDDAATLDEPSWYAMLSIVGRTEEGAESAHAWSRPYTGYSQAETNRKIGHALKHGPRLCATVRTQLPEGESSCATCPHWGKIRSPIMLGLPPPPPTLDKLLTKYRVDDGARHANGTVTNGTNGINGHDSIPPPPSPPPAPDRPADTQHEPPSRPLSELWNAQQLVELHGDHIRYCGEAGWFGYRDGVWLEDRTGHVSRLTKRMVKQWLREAARMKDEDEDKSKALASWAVKCHTASKIDSTIRLAQTEAKVAITITDFDRDPALLNVINGTVDLRTGTLRDHRVEDLLTKQCPVEFDADARCPRWESFLGEVFDGKTEMVGYLQRLLGYSLTSLQIYHLLVFLWGAGRNGKTTLLETVSKILGEYARSISSELLLVSRDNADYNTAQLRGVRLAITSETGQNRKVDESRVKLLTGGDTVPARHPYGRPFNFRPTHHVWLMSNNKPDIGEMTPAVWSRIKVLEFPIRFELPPEGVDAQTWIPGPHVRVADPSLPGLLEEEQAGILAWMVNGAVTALRDGLQEPTAVTEATARYREQMDVLGDFLDDCCEVGAWFADTSARLYSAYKGWCEKNGVDHVASNKFGMLLSDRGTFVMSKPTTGDRSRRWSGLAVKASAAGRSYNDD